MVCELLLLSAVWFLFVAFWLETVSVWVFLCDFYQDRGGHHAQRRWEPAVAVEGGVGGGAREAAITRESEEEPGRLLYILGSLDVPGLMER